MQIETQRQLRGDGIPFVRRLLPKHDHSKEVEYNKKHNVSLVNYLIQKSKGETLWRKSRFQSDSHLTPEIIFSKIDPSSNQPINKTFANKRSLSNRNIITPRKNDTNVYSSLNSRNKVFPRNHYDHILNINQPYPQTSFSKRK